MKSLIFFIVLSINIGAYAESTTEAPQSQPDVKTEEPAPKINATAKDVKKIASEKTTEQKISLLNQSSGVQSFLSALIEENKKIIEAKDDTALITDSIKNSQRLAETLLRYSISGAVDGYLPIDISDRERFLKSRISVNKSWKNTLAENRDLVELRAIIIKNNFEAFINYIIEVNSGVRSDNGLSETIDKELADIEDDVFDPKDAAESPLVDKLKVNNIYLKAVSQSYRQFLESSKDSKDEIINNNWYSNISISNAVKKINGLTLVKKINTTIQWTNTDVGAIIISLLLFTITIFFLPAVFRSINYGVSKLPFNARIYKDFIHNEIQTPIRLLMVYFGIYLGAGVAIYRTELSQDLNNISFVVNVFLLTWLLIRVIDGIIVYQINHINENNKELRRELFNLATHIIRGVIIILSIISVLNHFGISISAILSTLGIGGLAFALAAKDTLSNLFGGATILLDNVMRMGDWVKIDDVEGTVAEVGLRSTTIRTFDNALITIPNSIAATNSVLNWNRRKVGRRIKLWVGVTYKSRPDDIKQAILDIKKMLSNHPDISSPSKNYTKSQRKYKLLSEVNTDGIKNTQLVFLDRYGESSIDILIYCFSTSVVWDEWLATKEDVLFKIADILEANNLEFAYRTQVIIHEGLDNNDSPSPTQ